MSTVKHKILQWVKRNIFPSYRVVWSDNSRISYNRKGFTIYEYAWYRIRYSPVLDKYKLEYGGDSPECKKTYTDAKNKLAEFNVRRKKLKLIEL